MNKSRIILLCILSVLAFMNISAKNRGFAIFIDPISYKKVRPEIEQYAQSIEKQGLKTFIIEDKWSRDEQRDYGWRGHWRREHCCRYELCQSGLSRRETPVVDGYASPRCTQRE